MSLQIALIAAAAITCQWIAWRMHVPAIIFLLGTGFILGPVIGWVEPRTLMGDLLRPALQAAIAIILFEGSLQLHFKELRQTYRAIGHVIVLGAPIGWALISYAAHHVAGLEWPVAITLGGILIVTGPTVIMPMLRQARLNARVSSILKWEGIVNDPVGVIFAILAYEYFSASGRGLLDNTFYIGHGIALALVVASSFSLAHVIKRIFERGWLPEYLKTSFLLCLVLCLFFICNLILHESGLIAVTILGLTLTNIHSAGLKDIKRFKETITILLVSGVFILLTADLDASVLLQIDMKSVLFILCLLFIIRPLTFAICAVGTKMDWREVLLTGLIAPRGVVCAAMAGMIGPLLVEDGFQDGAKIFPIAFALVVLSVTLHSLMVKPLAKKLSLTSDKTNGVIIAGAYSWSVQLAETLKARNVPVTMVSNNWDALSKVRLADIPVYYGELLSEETELILEFNTYNTLIAATPNPAYNALLCEKFGYEYGTERVFRINPDDKDIPERQKISIDIQGRSFLSKETTLNVLWNKFEDGWRFRTTRVGRKAEKEAGLIIPEETENRTIAGIISKSGLVSFYSHSAGSRTPPKEDDYVILFEKEVPVEAQAQPEKAPEPSNPSANT